MGSQQLRQPSEQVLPPRHALRQAGQQGQPPVRHEVRSQPSQQLQREDPPRALQNQQEDRPRARQHGGRPQPRQDQQRGRHRQNLLSMAKRNHSPAYQSFSKLRSS